MKINLLVLLTLLYATSCAGPEAAVHAQPSGPSAISLDCSKEQETGQNDDGAGTLTINWGPCDVNATGNKPVGLSANVRYTLRHAISARVMDAWLGTSAGSRIEVGYYMKITTPDGRQGLFVNQFDKHQDVVGNSPPHQWNLPLNLPGGTQIDIGLALGVTNPDEDCPCGIHAQWFLNRGFD